MSDFPEEINKRVTRALHDDGIELTPEQVAEARKEAYKKIREEMRKHGYVVPEDDYELLKYMKRIGL